jgi:hypothetical protein
MYVLAAMFAIAPAAIAHGTPSAAMALPEVTSESEEGFHDLVFAVVSAIDKGTFRVRGKYKETPVGFEVRLGAAWKAGKLTGVDLVTYQGTIVLASVGRESDELVRVIDRLYGTKLSPRAFNAQTTFSAISLKGNPQDVTAGPVKLKLFFESKDERRYAEAYLNIDLATNRAQLREKDPGYRTALVLALGAGAKKPSN